MSDPYYATLCSECRIPWPRLYPGDNMLGMTKPMPCDCCGTETYDLKIVPREMWAPEGVVRVFV